MLLYFPQILIIFLLINEINSFLILKDVTVHSDVLRESFLSEIRKISDIPDVPVDNWNIYDSQKCLRQLKELTCGENTQGVQLFDAWGKIPSGFKSKSLYDVGNFDQCIKTSVTKGDEVSSGQFCFAQLPLKNAYLMHHGEANNFELNIAICIPDSCSPELLTSIFKRSFKSSLNGVLEDISVSQCTNGKRPPLKVIHMIGIFVFSLVSALILASTIYEIYINCSGKQPIPVLLAFSILTNGRKIFTIDTRKSPSNIDCLTGLRVLSMIWIIDHHAVLINTYIPAVNQIFYSTWIQESLWSMHAMNAAISVDTFFFMGGLLVAWAGFRELDKTNGKLNVIMMYVHRYIRLTPPVAAVLLFNFSLNEIVYTGPFRETVLSKNKCDSSNWWPILLYIQNYLSDKNGCLDETWYLSADFHLYLISPLLLIPLWKWGKKFVPVLVALSLTSIGYVITIYLQKGFTGVTVGRNFGEWTLTVIPTHARISAWLVGFLLGYFMHVNRQRSFQLPKLVQTLAWIGSFTILFSIVFGPYFIMDEDGRSTNFVAAMLEGWKRILWATALAWITFACHFGFGGIVNSVLSHPLWQPLARLSYALFIVHMTVLRINFGIGRTQVYVSEYVMVLSFWSAFGTSLKFAIFLALAFELPFAELEKYLFQKGKSSKKTE